MGIKKDIENRSDIELFINAFYEKVKEDRTIGFIFTEVVALNWEQHIPVIVDFWESILFGTAAYSRNAMDVHYKLNKLIPLQKKHFTAWLELFTGTLDEMYQGDNTELTKKRARSIASLMEYKMNGETHNK